MALARADESAGGTSVNALLASPMAEGLFHRAIAHAKQSTTAALQDGEAPASESKRGGPVLTIIK